MANRSATLCAGALSACAFSTSLIMCASVVSCPILVVSISKAPNSLSVPSNTSSPTPTSTGIDSPVREAWLTAPCPEATIPSTGICSPGLTSTRSPSLTSSISRTTSPSVRRTLAVFGFRSSNALIALPVLATVIFSSSSPTCMMKTTIAPAMYSSMMSEAIRAMLISTPTFMSLRSSPFTAPKTMGTPPTRAASKTRSRPKTARTRPVAPRTMSSPTEPGRRNSLYLRFIPFILDPSSP